MVVATEEFERLTDMRFLVSAAIADYQRSDGDANALEFLLATLHESLHRS